MKEKQVLTTGDVARYCGVHFRTVTRWIQRGHLKAFHLPGRGDSRIFVSDFLAFLKQNKIQIPLDLLASEKRTLRALIVEDDSIMARTIKRTLVGMGIECEIANDGFKAGMLLGTFRPDLTTLDLNVPGLGGFGVLEMLRSLDSTHQIKVLVISGMEEPQLKKAVTLGAHSYLKKPFSKQQLEARIRELTSID